MQIEPLGDNALLLRLETTQIDDAAVDALLDAARALENAALPGVIELAPAYTTLGVFYDPAAVETMSAAELPFDVLAAQIARALRATSDAKLKVAAQPVEIPVCYGGTFGPDLEHVAQHAGIAPDEVVKLHTAAVYRVSCIGFTPGFPYLAGLPSALATPRRSSPRKEVAAGSVGIGGKQTGIYPAASPGGWNLIGRTPMRLFDPHRSAPALLRAGDTVRFRAITRAEFDALQAP